MQTLDEIIYCLTLGRGVVAGRCNVDSHVVLPEGDIDISAEYMTPSKAGTLFQRGPSPRVTVARLARGCWQPPPDSVYLVPCVLEELALLTVPGRRR